MKILVFSDSHGKRNNMMSAIDMHYPNIDLIIHLGDGAKEFDTLHDIYPRTDFFSVKGNNDWLQPSLMTENTLDLDGHRIFCTHGHLCDVKTGLNILKIKAKERNCDIALFGHTHKEYKEYLPDEGMYLFNPGSISLSYPYCSFGLIEITRQGVLLNHAYIKYDGRV